MIQSILNDEIEYIVDKNIEENDLGRSVSVFEMQLFEIDVCLTVGEINDLYKQKNKKYIVSNLMSPTYETFLKYVAEHRNIPLKELRNKYAEGQVWAASHPAIQGKLIDKLSSLAVVKEEFNNKYKNKVDFIHYKVSSLYSKSSILGLNVDMKSETIEKLTNKINTIY